MMKMGITRFKQLYIPYTEWEDWLNGMWSRADKIKEPELLKQAIEFTGDHIKYGAAMREVIIAWPRTMLNSLTNQSINRRAFLGHCAVYFALKIPEYITRMAWGELTEKQRAAADKEAQQTINKFILEYAESNKRLHSDMGTQMLFEWNA